jgi:hypothetical protein
VLDVGGTEGAVLNGAQDRFRVIPKPGAEVVDKLDLPSASICA